MNTKMKSLFSYICPAVGELFVIYLYNVIDGIFVGRGVGSAALAHKDAVNISVPFITFVVAAAVMFPMGGATIVAIRMGRGDSDGANHAFMTALSMTALAAAGLMLAGTVFSREIVDMSGARELSAEMREMSAQYLFYYAAFSIPMLMSTCLSIFIRNDGSPALSFAGMCTGAAANIFLDWLFIYPCNMGIIGAAVASGLGQVFSLLVLMSHFWRKKGELRLAPCKIDLPLMGTICRCGVPEAVTQLTTPVTALCYNLVLASLIGDIGISAFSVLSFIYSLANAVLTGVAQGLQPLWGRCCGRRDTEGMLWYFRGGIIINTVLSILICGILFLFDFQIIRMFNREAALVQTAAAALPVFSLSFIPAALNLIFTIFLFSTKRTWAADIIAVSRGIVLKALAIFCMPAFFGSNAVWAAPVAAEAITLIFAVVLSRAALQPAEK